ncbi:MAG: hypothetical protein QXY30_01860 [Candidatus Bathyarchaeia archaeon]
MSTAYRHYSRQDVKREILDFCRGRWVALHYVDSKGNLIFKRYSNEKKPIKIEGESDLDALNNGALKSIYATINIYEVLQEVEDAYNLENIVYCTPTWDIDSELVNWRETIQVAREILYFLGKWGIKVSAYVKWSGNGCHVHINERSISESIREKYNPLDIAYAIVEYVKSKISPKIAESSSSGKISVENKIDLARVFTCPLSLHRELNAVCICMRIEDIEKFRPDWINPQDFIHNPNWREFKDGEADILAEKAYKTIGGYLFKLRKRRRKTKPLDEQILEWLRKE